ncbi:MAG: GNAT family N-acetyltransferase [Fimbriimonadaceae bacterium]|nr:GNAT family N-acetyltransferase [Fimbriimonadaceae bacterium]
MITSLSPILATADIQATVKFYTDVLGFTSSWTWGDTPDFGGANWGNVSFMFSLNPELAERSEGQEQWISVEDVDSLYAKHLENGALIVSAIEDKPWGRREYTVRDPSGYHLRFAGDPSHFSQGPGEFPHGVKIVRRMPTQQEYDTVAGSAFYKDGAPEGVLDRTWQGIVAINPDGEVIGTTRIMYDAPGWFSIWDVAVLPDWQGKRIGTAMMEEAIEIVREEAPGAFVFLFTFKHGFYERLGFSKGSVHMLKV